MYGTHFNPTTDTPDAPGKPTVTEINSEAACVVWKAPSQDGGAPISGYILEKKESSSTYWSKVTITSGEETSFRVTRLIKGSEYQFRVLAENRAGVGPASEPSAKVKAQDAAGESLARFHKSGPLLVQD